MIAHAVPADTRLLADCRSSANSAGPHRHSTTRARNPTCRNQIDPKLLTNTWASTALQRS